MKNYTNEIESVICPLSYGNNVKYKKDVMNAGKKAFGDKFFPIEEFMTIEKYKKTLSQTDIIIFDHWRQQAMGVTLTLLSLGKIVYVNSKTTSYKSSGLHGQRTQAEGLSRNLILEAPRARRPQLSREAVLPIHTTSTRPGQGDRRAGRKKRQISSTAT